MISVCSTPVLPLFLIVEGSEEGKRTGGSGVQKQKVEDIKQG